MDYISDKISFQIACAKGDIVAVKKYIKRISFMSWHFITESFEIACLYGQLEVAKCLFKSDLISINFANKLFPKVCMTPHINVSLWLRSILSRPLRIFDLLEISHIMFCKHKYTPIVLCIHNHLPAIYHSTAYHYRFVLMQFTPDQITNARATYYIETEYALEP
jgi:hypothetical protein